MSPRQPEKFIYIELLLKADNMLLPKVLDQEIFKLITKKIMERELYDTEAINPKDGFCT